MQNDDHPQDIQVLTIIIYGYVTLYNKRDFAGVFKLRILRCGDYPDYLDGSNIITRVIIRESVCLVGEAGKSEKEV